MFERVGRAGGKRVGRAGGRAGRGGWRDVGSVGRASWNKDASVYIITAETLMDCCIDNLLIVALTLSLSLLSLSLCLSLSHLVLDNRSSENRSLRESSGLDVVCGPARTAYAVVTGRLLGASATV